ncbi:MAG: DUF4838 domain-containing protein [Clostridia bacterium]|nr:DUF4838 domain-containing protein [Clostridia bacterium]
MLTINKVTSNDVIDYAAEELKKYLRMMMPECGNIKIYFNPEAKDGFRLGLMQDFNLDVSDAKDTVLDDILYIDCDEKGGIIAGSNYRSVLLSVYEYLRQNGCRWLMPGIDGEYIPMQDIKPVKYRFMPTNRYRGWCSEGSQFQQSVIDSIDFAPKIGLNVYFIQFVNPKQFYERYYLHIGNEENYTTEAVSDEQILQWKRQCETEIEKRGLQFHDMGHGFNYLPFGLKDDEKSLPEDKAHFFALLGGERKLYGDSVCCTQFCMSNDEARDMVSSYITAFAENHSNVDYLNVSLADGSRNQCECENCRKKTTSDWYVMLLNQIDEKLTKANLDTKISFISYTDTTWAPVEERIKNPDRFVLSFCPIFRSYAYSIPEGRGNTEIVPYDRNKNKFPTTLGASLDYFDEWKKVWSGPNLAFEYHYWRHQCYDLTGIMQAKLVNDDIKIYKENGFDGLIACGTQRCFFPSGLSFYTYARTLFDTSLSYEEIAEEYLSCAFGKDWKLFYEYFEKISDALPFSFFSRDEAWHREKVHYDPERAEKIAQIRNITKEGRKLIESHKGADARIRSISLKLLSYHADFCDLISDWMSAKARGEIDLAMELFQKARVEVGKFEIEIQSFFDHHLYFGEYIHAQNLKSPGAQDIVNI